MKMFPNAVELQGEICYIFRRLCYQTGSEGADEAQLHQIVIGKEGIALIMKAMKENTTHATIQLEALAALINLALNDENKKLISLEGGIELIMAAMKAHENCSEIQQFGCSALWNLACNEENRKKIGQEQGIEIIIKTMKKLEKDEKLQAKAAGALRNITRNCEDNRKIFFKENGMEVVEAAMKNHPLSSSVQSEGCRTIYTLARHIADENTTTELLHLVIATMKRLREDATVQHEGCMALTTLTYKDNRELIEGIQVVLEAMKTHPNNTNVQRIAIAVLADFCLNDKNEGFLFQQGSPVMQLMATAMVTYSKNESLQEVFLSVLVDFTRREKSLNFIINDYQSKQEGSPNIFKLLIQALKNFPSNGNLQKYGKMSLTNLANNSEAKQKILEAGGMRYLIDF